MILISVAVSVKFVLEVIAARRRCSDCASMPANRQNNCVLKLLVRRGRNLGGNVFEVFLPQVRKHHQLLLGCGAASITAQHDIGEGSGWGERGEGGTK